jgi:hypothetical protein
VIPLRTRLYLLEIFTIHIAILSNEETANKVKRVVNVEVYTLVDNDYSKGEHF